MPKYNNIKYFNMKLNILNNVKCYYSLFTIIIEVFELKMEKYFFFLHLIILKYYVSSL